MTTGKNEKTTQISFGTRGTKKAVAALDRGMFRNFYNWASSR